MGWGQVCVWYSRENGLCPPCRWAHPIYGVDPTWAVGGRGKHLAPQTHRSRGIFPTWAVGGRGKQVLEGRLSLLSLILIEENLKIQLLQHCIAFNFSPMSWSVTSPCSGNVISISSNGTVQSPRFLMNYSPVQWEGFTLQVCSWQSKILWLAAPEKRGLSVMYSFKNFLDLLNCIPICGSSGFGLTMQGALWGGASLPRPDHQSLHEIVD